MENQTQEEIQTTTTDEDVLVVVSKLKNYIRARSGMNTSGNVAPTLSKLIRVVCDRAIENAKNEGRKTVMDRDFEASSSLEVSAPQITN